MKRHFIWLAVIFLLFNACRQSPDHLADYSGWRTYAGTKEGIRYSSNENITTANVARLQLAWQYRSFDADTANRSQNQCNPIVVDGILYGTTPKLKLFALNAATGEQQWLFDPASEDTSATNNPYAFFKVCRGVTYWKGEQNNEARIFYAVGAKLYAVNAINGTVFRSFGKGGYIDLAEQLDRPAGFNSFVAGTTPGIIYKDLLITGARVAESADAAPGHIRAYDVHTGNRRWIFHTIPHPGETGYESWPDSNAYTKQGGANNWAGMSLDEKRGIVYVPTGSVSGDFYGGTRKGQNLFGNSLIALDAATGKYLWHFQVIHHDLWDRDLPANPNLVTLYQNGKSIDAVAQITKHGYVFLFDRVTGKPIFRIDEKPVPQEALPGEQPWPTQPIPTLPEPFARQQFNPEDVTDLSPEARSEMMEKYVKVKYRALFAPPARESSWIFPGYDGGGEWGGAAVDPETGILYVNSSELPWALTMVDIIKKNSKDMSIKAEGGSVYNKYCMTCHGPGLKGNGTSYPSLVNLQKKLGEEMLRKIVENGKNSMPAFRQIPESEKHALVVFLLNLTEKKPAANLKTSGKQKEPGSELTNQLPATKSILDEVPYTMTGYNRFLDKDGYPGIKPPWGTLNAVNLNTGELLWKVPLGEYPELTRKGIPPTGTEGYGGPLVTKGGLVFIAASKDAKIRAFDKNSGKVLWEAPLPVPGYATPATYAINGRQYVVIACGGGKIGSRSGDEYRAYALPEIK